MELLLPEAERYAGHNLMGSEMLAALGSGDLLVALLRAGLGRAGVEPAFAAALELDREQTTTAELLQRHLPSSKVVKAFNHIYAAELTTHGLPAGTPNRRALAIAGDDAEAKKAVAQLIDQFGFDVVDMGGLAESWRIQRDTPGYGPRRTAEELRRDLAAAQR